jgi:hypothetical protein
MNNFGSPQFRAAISENYPYIWGSSNGWGERVEIFRAISSYSRAASINPSTETPAAVKPHVVSRPCSIR